MTIEEIARAMGATIIAKLPDGPMGAFVALGLYQARMAELRSREARQAAAKEPQTTDEKTQGQGD